MNNRVWYYSIETRQLINDKEYHGTVSQVVLSGDYAAVCVEGQVRLSLTLRSHLPSLCAHSLRLSLTCSLTVCLRGRSSSTRTTRAIRSLPGARTNASQRRKR